MSIEWKKPRGDCKIEQIRDIEIQHGIKFPKSYIDVIIQFNGARPDKNKFSLKNREDCVFEELINWDKKRSANIYFWMRVTESLNVIPFAKDPFGNCICFKFRQVDNPEIVFWDHETNKITNISYNFDAFLSMLR